MFESNARSILRDGLAYDRCPVGVVTDMGQLDDVAEFHIDDEDALANVVRTQVDVVLSEGAAVLNAADPRVVELAELSRWRRDLLRAWTSPIRCMAQHRAGGERIVFVRDRPHHAGRGRASRPACSTWARSCRPPSSIRASVLAAIAAAWALGMPHDLICGGLRAFDATENNDLLR